MRLELDGEKVGSEERLQLRERIRDVRQGPDGAIWLATDNRTAALFVWRPRSEAAISIGRDRLGGTRTFCPRCHSADTKSSTGSAPIR